MWMHLLGQRARLLWRVEDFIVEDREVESQAQPNGVCRLHVLLADVEGILVGLLRVLHGVCPTQTKALPFTLLHMVSLHTSKPSLRVHVSYGRQKMSAIGNMDDCYNSSQISA